MSLPGVFEKFFVFYRNIKSKFVSKSITRTRKISKEKWIDIEQLLVK